MSKGFLHGPKSLREERLPEGPMHAWRTLGLAIPRRVASPQSPTPLHQASVLYGRRATARQESPIRGLDTRAVMGDAQEGIGRILPSLARQACVQKRSSASLQFSWSSPGRDSQDWHKLTGTPSSTGAWRSPSYTGVAGRQHLRSIKIVLQMDHLRCKIPQRVLHASARLQSYPRGDGGGRAVRHVSLRNQSPFQPLRITRAFVFARDPARRQVSPGCPKPPSWPAQAQWVAIQIRTPAPGRRARRRRSEG